MRVQLPYLPDYHRHSRAANHPLLQRLIRQRYQALSRLRLLRDNRQVNRLLYRQLRQVGVQRPNHLVSHLQVRPVYPPGNRLRSRLHYQVETPPARQRHRRLVTQLVDLRHNHPVLRRISLLRIQLLSRQLYPQRFQLRCLRVNRLLFPVSSRHVSRPPDRHHCQVAHRLGVLLISHQVFHLKCQLESQPDFLQGTPPGNQVACHPDDPVASRRLLQLLSQQVCRLANPRISRAMILLIYPVECRHLIQAVYPLQFLRSSHRVSHLLSRLVSHLVLHLGHRL